MSREDVEFVVRTMYVVARHPIEAFDVEQSEQGRRARRRVWEGMEGELRTLEKGNEEQSVGEVVSGDGRAAEGSKFFTPY